MSTAEKERRCQTHGVAPCITLIQSFLRVDIFNRSAEESEEDRNLISVQERQRLNLAVLNKGRKKNRKAVHE